MPTCPKCNKANPKRAKFCYDCGSPMYLPQGSYVQALGKPTVSVQQIQKQPPNVRVITSTTAGQMPIAAPTNQTRTVSMRIAPMGNCSYHRELPATYICSRCSRSICRACARQYLDLTFCPECHGFAAPKPRYY
ncbi:double zinc ribbon domain-containing protein [[Eubacterium] cellulosolvens]